MRSLHIPPSYFLVPNRVFGMSLTAFRSSSFRRVLFLHMRRKMYIFRRESSCMFDSLFVVPRPNRVWHHNACEAWTALLLIVLRSSTFFLRTYKQIECVHVSPSLCSSPCLPTFVRVPAVTSSSHVIHITRPPLCLASPCLPQGMNSSTEGMHR